MPPLWLIVGSVLIIAVTMMTDRLILKPRGQTFVLDGRTVTARRKKDSHLLMAIMLAMFVGLGAGVGLVQSDYLFLVLFAVPFGLIMLWTLWRALHVADSPPDETEVRIAVRRNRSMTRYYAPLLAIAVLNITLGLVRDEASGALYWTLLLDYALFPVFLWFLWRLIRQARKLRTSSTSI
jgi:hypothetical protein